MDPGNTSSAPILPEEDPFAGFDDTGLFEDGGAAADGAIDISAILQTFQSKEVMGSLEDLLRGSWKFIRLTDDLHDIRGYLNDIRICFIALTVSGYVGILLYALIMVCRRNRNSGRPAYGGNIQMVQDPEELHSVKTVATHDGTYTPTSPYHHGHGPGGPRRLHHMQDMRGSESEKAHMMSGMDPNSGGSPQVIPSLLRSETIREDHGEAM
jgi:hypothetical protein